LHSAQSGAFDLPRTGRSRSIGDPHFAVNVIASDSLRHAELTGRPGASYKTGRVRMDLIDLYQRHGESLLWAGNATSAAARTLHAARAEIYRERIRQSRARRRSRILDWPAAS
jgi:hypothetical protein